MLIFTVLGLKFSVGNFFFSTSTPPTAPSAASLTAPPTATLAAPLSLFLASAAAPAAPALTVSPPCFNNYYNCNRRVSLFQSLSVFYVLCWSLD